MSSCFRPLRSTMKGYAVALRMLTHITIATVTVFMYRQCGR